MATLSATFTLTDDIESDTTYHVSNNKIQGMVNELEALRQSVLKLLSVQKYDYEIYNFEYGVDLNSLIGHDRSYIEVESKRRIKEAILTDSRVTTVDGFTYTYDGDSVIIEFNVVSIYGTTTMSTEVAW